MNYYAPKGSFLAQQVPHTVQPYEKLEDSAAIISIDPVYFPQLGERPVNAFGADGYAQLTNNDFSKYNYNSQYPLYCGEIYGYNEEKGSKLVRSRYDKNYQHTDSYKKEKYEDIENYKRCDDASSTNTYVYQQTGQQLYNDYYAYYNNYYYNYYAYQNYYYYWKQYYENMKLNSYFNNYYSMVEVEPAISVPNNPVGTPTCDESSQSNVASCRLESPENIYYQRFLRANIALELGKETDKKQKYMRCRSVDEFRLRRKHNERRSISADKLLSSSRYPHLSIEERQQAFEKNRTPEANGINRYSDIFCNSLSTDSFVGPYAENGMCKKSWVSHYYFDPEQNSWVNVNLVY